VKAPRPRDLDAAAVRGLLSRVDPRQPLAGRIETLGRALLGRPYVNFPLIGSAQEPEVFTASLAGFDCVTFVESVLALALSATPARFADHLRRIRYAGGRVDWKARNHYTTTWLRHNARARFVRPVRLPAPTVTRARRLSVVPGYPVRRIQIACVPKDRFWRVRGAVRTGDIVTFVSTRSNLDIYHLGFAVWEGEELKLLNAARSKGCVLNQPLAEFLAVNRMAGLIVARPTEPG
jgi:hypothetical protein